VKALAALTAEERAALVQLLSPGRAPTRDSPATAKTQNPQESKD
jgi:hypothetical protein